jgi:hypothetical protein
VTGGRFNCLHLINHFFFFLFFFMQPDYEKIISSCNLWRNFDDIQDSWQSVASVIDYYGDNQDTIIPNAGPGHWNDPDMVRQFPNYLPCPEISR